MGWDISFIQALRSNSITPIYQLSFIESIGMAGVVLSNKGKLRITDARIQGTQVIPHRWSVSFGGFEVDLVGDITERTEDLKRGALAILFVEFQGLGVKEIIGIGQLHQIRGQRGVYRATFKDIISAFQTRFDLSADTSKKRHQLFFDTEVSTTADMLWSNHSYLQVTDGSQFTKSSNHYGLLYVIPGSGDPFYLGWDSYDASTKRFSLTSNFGVHPTAGASHVIANGNKVFNAARINGAPHEVFAQIITSTGTGTNGPNDVLPLSYGSGFPLNYSFFDFDNSELTKSYIKPSNSTQYMIDFSTIEPFSNGIRSFIDIFANVGQWPVMRQNSFTWRGCFDPTGKLSDQPLTSAHIFDDDIIQINDIDFFDSTLQTAFLQSRIVYNTSNTSYVKATTLVKSLPIEREISRDFGFYYDSSVDPLAMATADVARMETWDFNTWTRISLKVSLRFCTLCAGDKVRLTSKYIVDIYTAEGQTFVERPAMVLEISYNFRTRSCDIVLGFPTP